jgi:hypothetical protein
MLFNLLGITIFTIGLLALLTGLAIAVKWKQESEFQFRVLLGSLLGAMVLLLSLLYILWR